MSCKHENRIYQREEKDVNIPESYTCYDCGIDLDIPIIPDDDFHYDDKQNREAEKNALIK